MDFQLLNSLKTATEETSSNASFVVDSERKSFPCLVKVNSVSSSSCMKEYFN